MGGILFTTGCVAESWFFRHDWTSGRYTLIQDWTSGRYTLSQDWTSGRYTLIQDRTSGRYTLNQDWRSGRYTLSQDWRSGRYTLSQDWRSGWHTLRVTTARVDDTEFDRSTTRPRPRLCFQSGLEQRLRFPLIFFCTHKCKGFLVPLKKREKKEKKKKKTADVVYLFILCTKIYHRIFLWFCTHKCKGFLVCLKNTQNKQKSADVIYLYVIYGNVPPSPFLAWDCKHLKEPSKNRGHSYAVVFQFIKGNAAFRPVGSRHGKALQSFPFTTLL